MIRMSFLHGLSSHGTKSCLYNVDETISNNDQDNNSGSNNNDNKNDRSNNNQQQQQQQFYSGTSPLVSQANQQHQQQQQQFNVRMRRHPELVPVMPRERDLGLSTGSRNSNNNNNNNNNNGCSNSSSLTRPHLRANNNATSGSNSNSSSSRNHPMSSSYMGQQQIFNKQHNKDIFAKPQPKRCVSMTRLDQLSKPKRVFTKELIQSKPSPAAPLARTTPVKLGGSSTPKRSSQGPSSRPLIPANKTQTSPQTTSIHQSHHKVSSSEHMSINQDPISSTPENEELSNSLTTQTITPASIKSIKPNRVSLNNGSSLFDELNCDSPDLSNQSTRNSEEIADITIKDLREFQPESPVSKSDNSISIDNIIQNDLKNLNELNSTMDELCSDMHEASILSSVYHSPSSFQEGNHQDSFQSIIDTTIDGGSKNMVQLDKNNKPKQEDNEFLLRIKKEDEEKRLREEEELKEQLRKEEEEREARKRILDGIMSRVSKSTTPKSGHESNVSNGTLNDDENGDLDHSGTKLINIEAIETPLNY